jgi:hypothetical protein
MSVALFFRQERDKETEAARLDGAAGTEMTLHRKP